MTISPEGHVVVSPKDVYEMAVESPASLVDRYLIPGTPKCFGLRNTYYEFLEHIASHLAIHPRNIILKGSTKIGFSISPRPEKLWMSFGEGSDLDIAVIDSAYYDRLDNEVRHWERLNTAAIMQNVILNKTMRNRVGQRKNYCCRYFDMPDVLTRSSMVSCFETVEAENCSGCKRNLDAFVFKDWWSLRSRYEDDIKDLVDGVKSGKLPTPPEVPVPYIPDVQPG